MKLALSYRYTTQVIPPRCRKPRHIGQTAAIALTLRETTAANAPVAIIEHNRELNDDSGHAIVDTVYRWFMGNLYVRAKFQRACREPSETQTAEQFAADPYPFRLTETDHRGEYDTQAEQVKRMRSWANSILFIDGERWEVASEPRYVVMTFGLGCNHGLGFGTSLEVDYHYNQNIGRSHYFRIDQYDAAVAETTRVATERGDTKALPVEATQCPTRFEILIPESVKINPRCDRAKD